MIRLFASDMDGTLLNDKGYISDRTINAVKKLQKHGIHFIVNTGRDYRAAKRELDAASLSCDMICHSGACTYDVHGNGFHIASLPKSIAKQIPIQIHPSLKTLSELHLLVRNNLPHEWKGTGRPYGAALYARVRATG